MMLVTSSIIVGNVGLICGQVMYSFLRMGLPPRLEGAGVDRLVTL